MKKIYLLIIFLLPGFYNAMAQVTCTAGFTFTSAGTAVNFNGSVTSSFPFPVKSWYWTFGDGSVDSTTQTPIHTYSLDGTYTVCLTVTLFSNSCIDSVCKQVVVNSANCGSATFTQSVTGSNVGFSDKTLMTNPVTSWTWDFGDGSGSNAQNPVHTYSQSGKSYYACLTSSDGQGCSKSFCDSVKIPVPGCVADFTVTVTGDSVVVTDVSQLSAGPGVALRTWDFGDGTVLSFVGASPGHKYAASGTYMICLIRKDFTDPNCNDSICKPVGITVGINEKQSLLSNFTVYPNPANTEFFTTFFLKTNTIMRMAVYDLLGNKVEDVLQGESGSSGENTIAVSTVRLQTGAYFIRMNAGGYSFQKMIVISR